MARFSFEGKGVHYEFAGTGPPVVLLHGNSASSRMFWGLTARLARCFRVILVDLPGHGRSERLEAFPVDFWHENARAVAALVRHLELPKAHLVGSSGGALVALNLALERPELVGRVVADSFEGERSVAHWVAGLRAEREESKRKLRLRLFWWLNHGPDWRHVVDQDTDMNERFHAERGAFFHRDLSELRVPVLLTGSRRDEYLPDIEERYRALAAKIPDARVHLFHGGGHPAALTCARSFERLVTVFLARG